MVTFCRLAVSSICAGTEVVLPAAYLNTCSPPIHAVRIFAGGYQRKADVRGGVDRNAVVGISPGHICDVGEQTTGNCGKLIGRYGQNVAAHRFARSQRCFIGRSLPALPCDRQRGARQGNRHLVGIDDGSDDQLARCARPVRHKGPGVDVADLRSRLIAPQMNGLGFSVRQVDDRLAARCDNCHRFASL